MISFASAERVYLLAAVARHGTMTKAAAAVGYTVSAVSQQIRKLEEEAGQTLLYRHSRGAQFTDAGQVIVDHAEQISSQMRSMQDALDDIAGARAGSLRMGTFPTAGSSLLPLALSRFHKEHPDIDLTVNSHRQIELLQMLHNRDVSMTLLWEYQWAKLDLPNVNLQFLLDDPTVLVVPDTHPLAGRKSVTVPELLDETWVIRSRGHPMIDVIIKASQRAGFYPKVSYEANDYLEVQAMVAIGIGISLVPKLAMTVQRNDVRIVPIKDDVPTRRILLARLKDSYQSPVDAMMTKLLIETASDLQNSGPPLTIS